MILTRTGLKLALSGALAAGALFGMASATAGTSWSVGVSVPGVVVSSEPAPVYYEPAPAYSPPPPVYYQPAPPVRYQPPAYVAPAPVYYEPGPSWEELARSAANGAAANGSAASTIAATVTIGTDRSSPSTARKRG